MQDRVIPLNDDPHNEQYQNEYYESARNSIYEAEEKLRALAEGGIDSFGTSTHNWYVSKALAELSQNIAILQSRIDTVENLRETGKQPPADEYGMGGR